MRWSLYVFKLEIYLINLDLNQLKWNWTQNNNYHMNKIKCKIMYMFYIATLG